MKLRPFKTPEGSSKEKVEIYGIPVSKYRLSFLEKNFDITEADLKNMSEAEAKTWIYKIGWINEYLRQRFFETVPSLYIAEEYFGIKTLDDLIAVPPEEFLGDDGLYKKVKQKRVEEDY